MKGPRIRNKMRTNIFGSLFKETMVLFLNKCAKLLKLFQQNNKNVCKALRECRKQNAQLQKQLVVCRE